MSFLSFFGRIGHALTSPKTAQGAQIAGAVLTPFAPGMGAIVETIAGAVYSVENLATPGASGTDKKDQVKSIIDVAAPVATSVLNSIAGRNIVDPSKVAPIIDTLIDDVVELFNALGVFTHAAPAAAAAPAVAAVVPAVAPAVSEPFIPAGVPSGHAS